MYETRKHCRDNSHNNNTKQLQSIHCCCCCYWGVVDLLRRRQPFAQLVFGCVGTISAGTHLFSTSSPTPTPSEGDLRGRQHFILADLYADKLGFIFS